MYKKIMPAMALLALLCGCQKTVVEHPAAPVQADPMAVCPKVDTDLEFEDRFYSREGGEEPTTCNDGKVYCYSVDSRPIVRPDAPDGWICQFVQKLPATHVFPNTYVFYKTYGYFGDGAFYRKVKTDVKWSFLKAWVCENEECACGAKSCPQNGICIDGECYCNDTPYQGGTCEPWEGDESEYANEDEENNRDEVYATSCKDKKGNPVEDCYELEKGGTLYCGDAPITEKPTSDGRTIQHCLQIDDGKYGIYYQKEDGNRLFYAMPHTVFDNVQAERKKNRKNSAYRCGSETCIDGEICLDNACVSLGTRSGLPDGNYAWKNHMPVCAKADGCACGDAQCAKDQFCIEGECKDSPRYQKLNGNLVYYDLATLSDASLLDDAEEIVWLDILTHPVSRTCGNAPIPADTRDYACMFRLKDGENERLFWSAEGFRCTAPDGCACGKARCAKDEYCAAPDKCHK